MSRETDRPHRALEEKTEAAYLAGYVRGWSECNDDDEPPEGWPDQAWESYAFTLAPEQRGEGQEDLSGRLTLILLTPGLLPSDRETIKKAAAALAAPPQEGERQPGHTDLMVSPESIPDYLLADQFGISLREARVAAGLSLRETAALLGTTAVRLGEVERGVAPTPDREALRDLIAAPPPREPDWLREYERRKLALIEAATICGRDGSNPEQDTAERALDDWVLAALPGGREREPAGWRPIATAPKGTTVLAWGGNPEIGLAWWWENRWEDPNTGHRRKPTHWMPLPAAPQASADTGERA
jgi:transcriptional regulator with XRE-family HTH domain